MDLFLIILIPACLAGIILPFLLPFCTTLLGSADPGGWHLGGAVGPVTILLAPERMLYIQVLNRTIWSGELAPEEEGMRDPGGMSGETGEDETTEDLLDSTEGLADLPLRQILKLPVSLDSLYINGTIGTGDAGRTGELYGWLAGVRGACSGSRLHINVVPDFTKSSWSIRIRARIRIRSLFELIQALIPIVRTTMRHTHIP
ncbi:MAG: DUF2953 domain-containing protein [Methanocalculus sp. MSAO_Arc1]|nr:DUF2953 domain-containing protein [Methanocalculus sp. MSAO_Arc1]RQD81409.1 MAG: DUF2953 domain-containing protein [Methanocalculus sp. MSAO_Arc1]